MPTHAPRLTLFSIPKAFEGHSAVIQTNAIRSWTALGLPVLIMGNDPGVAEACAQLKVTHVPDVAVNELGTPLLDSAFRIARQRAATPYIGYVNGDIIFLPGLSRTIDRLRLKSLLAVGRRTNIDITELLDFTPADWAARLEARVKQSGVLETEWAIDYFIIERGGPLTELPPFAVGRPHWDNWMIARAMELKIPVADLTRSVLAVHQNHGYGHVKQQRGPKWGGPEADKNKELMAGKEASIGKATWFADERGRVTLNRTKVSQQHFHEGFALRTTDRAAALKRYAAAFKTRPRLTYLLAAAKLALPKSMVRSHG
jgi:hypothetical protein